MKVYFIFYFILLLLFFIFLIFFIYFFLCIYLFIYLFIFFMGLVADSDINVRSGLLKGSLQKKGERGR
jgi:hypothetical protein